jgi:hypothetical protein
VSRGLHLVQESHEAISVLDTSSEEARRSISFYFKARSDSRPAGASRAHIRLDPERLGGTEIPRGAVWAPPRDREEQVCEPFCFRPGVGG